MGAVDLKDQGVANLRVGVRMKMWWWPLFSLLLNVSVHNAWQVYRPVASARSLEKL